MGSEEEEDKVCGPFSGIEGFMQRLNSKYSDVEGKCGYWVRSSEELVSKIDT